VTEANFVYTYPPTPGRDYSKGRSLIEQWSVKIPSSLSTHIHTGSMIEQNEEKEEEEREKNYGNNSVLSTRGHISTPLWFLQVKSFSTELRALRA
jgi:hypothetical protein